MNSVRCKRLGSRTKCSSAAGSLEDGSSYLKEIAWDGLCFLLQWLQWLFKVLFSCSFHNIFMFSNQKICDLSGWRLEGSSFLLFRHGIWHDRILINLLLHWDSSTSWLWASLLLWVCRGSKPLSFHAEITQRLASQSSSGAVAWQAILQWRCWMLLALGNSIYACFVLKSFESGCSSRSLVKPQWCLTSSNLTEENRFKE